MHIVELCLQTKLTNVDKLKLIEHIKLIYNIINKFSKSRNSTTASIKGVIWEQIYVEVKKSTI